MPPEIILGPDDDRSEAARELLKLAGPNGTVEVRTDRSGPAFDVDDATYGKWTRKHKPGDEQRQINAVAEQDRADRAEFEVHSDDQVPDDALNIDTTGDQVADVAGQVQGDELPASAVNAPPPANADQPDTGDAGEATDGDAGEQTNSDPDARTTTTPTKATKATKATRSRASKATKATGRTAGANSGE